MNNEKIEKILKTLGAEELPADVMKIAEHKSRDFEKTLTQSKQPKRYVLGDIIMKSRLIKLAAAAVIIIAVLIGLNPFRPSITFADVVEPILNAKTLILDMIIGSEETGTVMHEIVAGPRIRRTLSNMPNIVQIIDTDSGQMLALDTEAKTASYINIEGYIKDATQNYVKFLRQVIRQVKDGQVEKIGEQVIDGRKAVVFVGRGQNEEVTIWADPETGHPLRIELQVGQMHATMKNFEFDVYVEDALVSMDVPNGYTLQKANVDIGDATEQDFIESLRIWAKVLGDGVFPEAIGTEEVMKQMPAMIEKLKEMNIPAEEGMDMGMKVGLGMIFHQMLYINGVDLHYAGAGVKLGDAQKVIFWYRPKGSETYRVIYGDLSVKDVAPENLPQ